MSLDFLDIVRSGSKKIHLHFHGIESVDVILDGTVYGNERLRDPFGCIGQQALSHFATLDPFANYGDQRIAMSDEGGKTTDQFPVAENISRGIEAAAHHGLPHAGQRG